MYYHAKMSSPPSIAALEEVHPCFRAGLAKALAHVEREGLLPPRNGARLYQATKEAITLVVAVADVRGRPTILAARHAGARSAVLRAACEAFCRIIEGLPFQEATEHGVIHLIDRLRDPEAPRPVQGILTPKNCGRVFQVVEGLIRASYSAHVAERQPQRRTNFWNPAPPEDWKRLSKTEQVDRLRPIMEAHLRAEGISPGDMTIRNIDRGLRVEVCFGPGVAPQRKPKLLMRLERRLRRETGHRLEAYVEEMRDQNVIRRLDGREQEK